MNGGQFHQTIASLGISQLLENLPMGPVMVAQIASAQLINPRQITAQPGIISFFTQVLEMSIDIPLSILSFLTTNARILSFKSRFHNYNFIISIIIFESASLDISLLGSLSAGLGLSGNPQPQILVASEAHCHLGNASEGVTVKISADLDADRRVSEAQIAGGSKKDGESPLIAVRHRSGLDPR